MGLESQEADFGSAGSSKVQLPDCPLFGSAPQVRRRAHRNSFRLCSGLVGGKPNLKITINHW